MNTELVGWVNLGVMVAASVAFTVLYALSVRPAHLAQRIGAAAAYPRCAHYRLWASVLMFVVLANYVLYLVYPLPVDPFPARFTWPYWINVIVVIVFGGPALWVFVRGMRDAGEETMTPRAEHTLYGGIYESIRHPQALGEAPMWLAMALLLNSPFLAVFSLLYLPVWYWWCVVEEQDLLLRYGDAYAEYRARTGMLFPRWRS